MSARQLLQQYGLGPKKSFGQNFLVADDVSRSIAESCVLASELGLVNVLELGAGTGALTRQLLQRAKSLVAVERDRDLIPLLEKEFSDDLAPKGRLSLVEGDAKTASVSDYFPEGPRVLCGNLPYQITGPLLSNAIAQAGEIVRAVFLVQREVAERLAAKEDSKDYGALTVFAQCAFSVSVVRTVSAGCFYPPPNVESAVVALTTKQDRAQETKALQKVVKAAFGQRRKTLRNAWKGLAPESVLQDASDKVGIKLDQRGETLTVAQFVALASLLEEALR